MNNLIKFIDNYTKKTRNLWQYCGDKSAVNEKNDIVEFNVADPISDLFNFKEKITGQTGKNGEKVLK